MTIQEIFDLALQMGIAADPRGKAGVKKYLVRKKKAFDDLPEKKKQYFDKQTLDNPYVDTRIMVGDAKAKVKRVLAGIDMNIGEVLLADRLTEKGQKIDTLIAHHPEGAAYAGLAEVMDMQIAIFAKNGVPITAAEKLMDPHSQSISHRIHPRNHAQTLDAARLLNIPMIALHTVWDNMGHTFLQTQIDKAKPETVGDVMDAIMAIPEFQEATRLKAGPYIGAGSDKNYAGKVLVGFTGGTDGPKEMVEYLARAGVGTLVDMHVSDDHAKEIKKYHMNLIVTGHIASDSIGGNLFFDVLEKKGIEVIPCSGFIRQKRT